MVLIGYILFLFRQEKYQKKPSKGALRANAPPLQSPAASPAVLSKTAGRRERSRRQEQDRDDVLSRRENIMQFFRCAREGYIGEGAFVARERGISASTMPLSLSLSCADTRK